MPMTELVRLGLCRTKYPRRTIENEERIDEFAVASRFDARWIDLGIMASGP